MTRTVITCDCCGKKIEHSNPLKISFYNLVTDSSPEKFRIIIPEPFADEEVEIKLNLGGTHDLCNVCYGRIMTVAMKKFFEIYNQAKEAQKAKRHLETLVELKDMLQKEIAVHYAPRNEMEQGFVKGLTQVVTYFIEPMIQQQTDIR